MAEDVTEIFALVVERKNEGPMIWETSGQHTSRESMRKRLAAELANPMCVRAAMVRIEFEDGNEAVLHAMKGMQK